MKSSKFFAGGILASVLYFFLGYLLYGLLFKNFFDQNGMAVDMHKFVWWAMIVSNLAAGFIVAYILSLAGVSTVGRGFVISLIVGALVQISFDMAMYGTAQSAMDSSAIAVDIILSAIMAAIAGGAVGWVYGSGKKNKAAA
jgi:hypothetical protein